MSLVDYEAGEKLVAAVEDELDTGRSVLMAAAVVRVVT